jgi:uncharacterized protein (DUF433 family)
MKKLIASAAVAGMVIVGGGAVAVAAPAPDAGTSHPAAAGHRRAIARGALATAAETIGISPADLRSQLKDGKTVAQVAQDHDVTAQQVVDAVVAKASARIDTAVANGKLDADRAATLKQKLPDAVTKLVNHELDGKHRPRRARVAGAVKVAADTIGIGAKDLATQVRDGKTVAQVAQDHGVEPQAVIDALVGKAQARIDKAVAAGRIDAERGQQLTEKVTARVTKLVNETPHRKS